MGDRSQIEWTDATWNPVTGCSRVSPGCEHCYAETLSLRMGWSRKPWSARNAAENVVLHPERLTQPLRWTRPRHVFVNSMSDLFHERIPDAFIDQVFAVMALASHHTFQVLTKRPQRMLEYFAVDERRPLAECAEARVGAQVMDIARARGEDVDAPGFDYFWDWPLPNVWLGVSVEDQRRADERIPLLLATPAAVRWLSIEPLLGPVNIGLIGTVPKDITGGAYQLVRDRLHWVVVGGESGPEHRPMDPAWARQLRDECQDAGVPFFFKQWGGRTPKSGGRELDGRVWDEMPAASKRAS